MVYVFGCLNDGRPIEHIVMIKLLATYDRKARHDVNRTLPSTVRGASYRRSETFPKCGLQSLICRFGIPAVSHRRFDNDRQPVCVNGVAMSRSAVSNIGQLKAVGST